MTEEERQEKFREEMRGYISADKKALENLTNRVEQLEKTVIHGNGNPPLIGQITEMRTRLEIFGTEINDLKTKVGAIADLRADIATLKTELRDEIKNRSFSTKNWVAVGITILTVVGTAVVQYFLTK